MARGNIQEALSHVDDRLDLGKVQPRKITSRVLIYILTGDCAAALLIMDLELGSANAYHHVGDRC